MSLLTPLGERGNALFLILLVIVLFSALSFALTRSMRGGVKDISAEKAILDAGVSAQCTAYVEKGGNFLEILQKCPVDQVSYELPDGTNENPQNPSNTACFVFHSDGAGLTPCGPWRGSLGCDLMALAPGQKCSDADIIYVGVSGGNRIYTTTSDQGTASWDNGSGALVDTGTTSNSDGLANTNTLVALSGTGAPFAAAVLCRTLGSEWYLPANDELTLLYNNRALGALSGTFDTTSWGDPSTGWYFSSTAVSNWGAKRRHFADGTVVSYSREVPVSVRCVRR